MKKRSSLKLLFACVMVILFTGCGAETEKADEGSKDFIVLENDSKDVSRNEVEEEPAELSTSEDSELSVAEICERLREDYDTWCREYETPAYGWVRINGKDYYYMDTYPDNEWNVEEVAEFYRSHRYYWGEEIGKSSDKVTKEYLWTPDYEQCFCANIAENWLYIDGVKATPLKLDIYSMQPEDLVQAFQNRDWNGVQMLYSDDFSTSVVMEPKYGMLEYEFRVEYYPDELDPKGVAYTGYADAIPWWVDETQMADVVVMPYYSGDDIAPDYHVYDECEVSKSKVRAAVYVDVPWELQSSLLAVQHAGKYYYDENYNKMVAKHDSYARRTDEGLYVLVDSGVELWRAGRLRQRWQLDITEDSYIVAGYKDYWGTFTVGRNYVYSNGKLYELFDDGNTEVLIDNIVSVNLSYKDGGICNCFTIDEDNVLRFYNVATSYWFVNREIATDVVAADLSNDKFVLYTDADGLTYAVYDFLGTDSGMAVVGYEWQACYEIACLGEGSIEDFQKLYDESGYGHSRESYEKFIKETSAKYLEGLDETSKEPTA